MDSPFNDLTNYKAIGLLGKLMKKRWQTTEGGRQAALDLVERVVDDDSENIGNRLKAVELQLKMEAMNQVDERIELLLQNNAPADEGRIVLILPPNGSEITDSQ